MPEQSNGNGAVTAQIQEAEINKPITVREFVFRYLKYLPLIIICIAIALLLAFIRIRYAIPIYRVQSSLLIKNDQNSGTGDGKLGQLLLMQPSVNMLNEIEILKSSPVIQRVVDDLSLEKVYYNVGKVRSTRMHVSELPFYMDVIQIPDSSKWFSFSITLLNNDEFSIGKEKKKYQFGQPLHIGTNECVLFRQRNIPVEMFKSPEFQVNWWPKKNAAENIIGNLKINQVNEYTTILGLTLQTENINVGIDVLNMLMSVYDSIIVEDKNRIAINTLRFIDKRLDTLKNELGDVEGSLSIFMEKNETFNIQEQSKMFLGNIETGSSQLAEQEVKINILNWLYEYVSNEQNVYKLVPSDLGIAEPSLTTLVAQYNQMQLQREANLRTTTESNPIIGAFNAQLARLRSNLEVVLQNVKQTYLIAKNSIEQKNQEFHGRFKSLPSKSLQSLNIERKQKILEDLYSFLLQKRLETSISSASTISNSRALEPATGRSVPISPDKNSMYTTYILIGLVVPIGLIAIIELMSDKVRSRIEIERATTAPIVGEIGHSKEKFVLVVTKNSRKFIAEQFRIIRTNLQYFLSRVDRPVIMVTSSVSGEGKSFVSTNIGAAIALTGKKTVIMEFDIRKPKILTGLELKRKMGITNFIIGKAEFEQLPVAVEGIENLYVIPCGPIPPNPAELLLEPKMKELMAEVKKNFEVVIMDTAPAGLVSDAVHLGEFADCTLYIIRRGYTARRILGLVQDLYIQKKLPSISVILNDIDLEGGYYGGGYYGGYGYYGYGYGHEGGYFEKEVPQKRTLKRRISKWYSRWFS